MPKIDQTIESLLSDAHPVKVLPRPAVSFGVWAVVTIVASCLIAGFSGLRPDLLDQFHQSIYVTEVLSLICLIAATALVAVWLAFPDTLQTPRIVYLPLVPLFVYFGCVIFRIFNPDSETVSPEDAENGINCVICITLYSLVPGAWMFWTLRKHATTHPMLAGGLSLLASASIGLLVLKFLEANDSVVHLLVWHIIPIFIFGLIGSFLGRKFLRW